MNRLPQVLASAAGDVASRLVDRGESIAVAESSAGGLICASLLSVAGASAYFRGGTVIYTVDGARAMLGDATDLDPGTRGACEPFARFLAAGARAKLGADWGVGETGAAGPKGNRYGDPPGHAWLAFARPDGDIRAEQVGTGEEDRGGNMVRFAELALLTLLEELA